MKELKPGRELDRAIAEKVMGWTSTCLGQLVGNSLGGMNEPAGWCKECGVEHHFGEWGPHPRPLLQYSTDIAAAWEVLTCGKWTWTLEEMDDNGRVSCYLENEDEDIWVRELADTASHAICLAALRAVETKSTLP